MSTKKSEINRRGFLQMSAGATGAGLLLGGCGGSSKNGAVSIAPPVQTAPPVSPFTAPPIPTPRIGIIGVGQRGKVHLQDFLQYSEVRVAAICDVNPENILSAQDMFATYNKPMSDIYLGNVLEYERMCGEADLDLIVIATPWEWHTPMAVCAMENGKHVGIEVPAAVTLDECWQLVSTSEEQQKHCVMLENVNYYEAELLALNLVRNGVLGELVHCEGAYLHDLRAHNLDETRHTPSLWRAAHHLMRNGNLYPTHGLGPLGNCMNINRGDRLASLVSMSSISRGMREHSRRVLPRDHPMHDASFACGDYNSSLIKTELGRSIFLNFATGAPRPYSRINMLQGTKGIFEGFPERSFLDVVPVSTASHQWDSLDTLMAEYRHPLRIHWENELKFNRDFASHGGADTLMNYCLTEALRNGTATDMDVYDAAVLSAVAQLSEESVMSGSMPIEFPDFTRGRWRDWPPHDYELQSPAIQAKVELAVGL